MIVLDPTLLRTFLTVAETGSFSSAAEILNCVQSNVTGRIRRLEEHFGQPVFHRGRGGAQLSVFGKLLKVKARALLAEYDSIERELLEAAGRSAPLILGSLETIAATRLPKILKAVQEKAPDSSITLETGSTAELLNRVWKRNLDAAIVAGPIDPDRFRSRHFSTEQLAKVTGRINASDEALLALKHGCIFRTRAKAWMDSSGRSEVDVRDMGSIESILACVDVGMGFAVAPRIVLDTHRLRSKLEIEDLVVSSPQFLYQ